MKVLINYQGVRPLAKRREDTLRSHLRQALKELHLKGKVLSLTFVDNKGITELNERYLARPFPTNVLAFPVQERIKTPFLGDVVISLEKVLEEANTYNLSWYAYLLSLCLHGLLHLLGYDHEKGFCAPWLMVKNEINLIKKIYPDKDLLKFLARREFMPAKLAVNVDHVATVREARRTIYPDPVQAAVLVELGGADGVVVHLRLDRRHIKERDVRLIKEVVRRKMILEMAIDKELIKFAIEVRPYQVTLVPERPEEITTEGGIELEGKMDEVRRVVKELNKGGIKVSLFVDPEERIIELAKKTGAQIVELHTGQYAEAEDEERSLAELNRIEIAARLAKDLGLIVHAGHGLNYTNIEPIAALPEIEEFSIGHSIISRAILVGLKEAVKEMKELILRARA